MRVKEFLEKLKMLGFDDETLLEFEMTDYENSFHYPELGIEEVNVIPRAIDDKSKYDDILISLKY